MFDVSTFIIFCSMFQHYEVNRNKSQENKWQEGKRHSEFVDPVRWQTHLLWGLPSQEGNPLV